jgi:molybdate transport system substrate-binding protein
MRHDIGNRLRHMLRTPSAALLAATALASATVTPLLAAEAQVAVAGNFATPMRAIIERFQADSEHRIRASYGSTGKLYAQIKNGAPFAVLLAADQARPERLEADGAAVPGSRFTYAVGKLALWSARSDWISDGPATLRSGDFNKLAIANPKLAPYGQAAMETLAALGVEAAIAPKLVRGENVAQTYQFIDTGNAALGFVALSQLTTENGIEKGSAWVVPADLHAPIRQDAVLLRPGADNAAATALLDYLRSEPAKVLIRSFGYGILE